MSGIVSTAISQTLAGSLAAMAGSASPFEIALHREYTPGGRTSTNIVPELLAIILSMTIVMITAVAIVKERERGIMEMLIFTPVRPAEVMLGKILPYVLVGYVQTAVFMPTAFAVFNVPFTGSFLAFFYGFNLFVLGNLALGFLISTLASNQMQAMQLSFSLSYPRSCFLASCFPLPARPAERRRSAPQSRPRTSSS